MRYSLNGLTDFLKRSPSMFHAVDNISSILKEDGFTRLEESDRWSLKAGGAYFVTRNRSSVIAFRVPEGGFAPFVGVASHSDSPTFRIKRMPELDVAGRYTVLNTEKYGGMIMNTWMDRPLGVAGRVLVRTENGLETRLVDPDRDMLVIPNLAIHMNREMNDGVKLNAQVDTLPLYGPASARGGFDEEIARAAGVEPDAIAGSDLYLYSRVAPSVWGPEGCYISAGRLDDLECAYTSMCAFTSVRPKGRMSLLCVFDNEEVGSGTKQGADSTFLYDVLVRAATALGSDAEGLRSALASSLMVSADNAHALHPNHPEKADAQNRPYMNEGIVVKFSANQKYTSDGATAAIFTEICRRAGVPVQYFHNRSDSLGGSTLGNISGAHVSVATVDIGLAQLAMHSSWETAGTVDAEYMVKGLEALYGAQLTMTADGCWRIG